MQLAIEQAMDDSEEWPHLGPVEVELAFTVKKPQSAPKRKRTWPITRPDIDKLSRTILDALTNSGAIRDDSQVVVLHARKTYPLEHPDALLSPGSLLRVWTISDPITDQTGTPQ